MIATAFTGLPARCFYGLTAVIACFCLALLLPGFLNDSAWASPGAQDAAPTARLAEADKNQAKTKTKTQAKDPAKTWRKPESKPAPVFRPPSARAVATRSFIHKDERCSVMVNYPQVGNGSVDNELDFWARQTVRTFVEGVVNLEIGQGGRFSMLVDYEISEPSDLFLSIVFRISTETGGAHPDPGMVTFSYDLSDGRRVNMQDLFADPAGLLRFLSLHSYERLLAELGPSFEERIKIGTSPDYVNFSLFALSPEGLVLYFPPYQVADYAHGEKKVLVAAEKLRAYKPHPGIWPGEGGLRSGLVHLGDHLGDHLGATPENTQPDCLNWLPDKAR